jgi:hypothetical protein
MNRAALHPLLTTAGVAQYIAQAKQYPNVP